YAAYFVQDVFVAIGRIADAVDDDEVALAAQRHQWMVPGSPVVVHALAGAHVESADGGFVRPVARAVGRHHGDERCLAAGNPGLAAQAMVFEHGNAQRKLERIAPRHADAGLAVVAPELDTPQVVISPGGPAVDRKPGPSAHLDYIAEGCEGFLVQSFEL